MKNEYSGTLEQMIKAAYGKNFNDPAFGSFVKRTELNILHPLGAVELPINYNKLTMGM